jgi:hypothetical protein
VSATRRQLVLGGGLFALAPATATAADGSDVGQLEHLLALERRLESAYATALQRDSIDPALGESLLSQEREHVRGLEQALRGSGRREPRAVAPAPLPGTAAADRRAFARFALDLERQTVSAYLEVLATLGNERLLQPLGAIMASDAQHEVALRQALGVDLLGS